MHASSEATGPTVRGALSADSLVVGFDGTPGSVDALALATPLARLWKVGIHVVTVHHPVMLGGRRAEDDHELAAAECARDGAGRLGASIPVSWGETRAADPVQGLHREAVNRACLVIGRPRHRLTDRGLRRTVLEDAAGPVAIARRGLLPRPELRHVVLGLTGQDGLDVLLRFAGRLRHHRDVAVTVGALHPAVTAKDLLDADFEVGEAIGRRPRSAIVPVREAARRWDGDDLLVRVGRPRGAHGHQGPDDIERALLAQDGPSLLVLPPDPCGTA